MKWDCSDGARGGVVEEWRCPINGGSLWPPPPPLGYFWRKLLMDKGLPEDQVKSFVCSLRIVRAKSEGSRLAHTVAEDSLRIKYKSPAMAGLLT